MATIVVATDFSTRSDRALTRASMVAKEHGSELLLVHVIDDDQPPSVVNAHRIEADKLLYKLKGSVTDLTGVACRAEVLLGEPFEQLPTAAAAAGAWLIVVGPHRRQVLRDQFRGTTVERSIRRSKTPVLVANAAPAGRYDQVMLTTDLSSRSAALLKTARSLPLLQGQRMTLLHVFEPMARAMLSRSLVGTSEIESYVDVEQSRAASELREFADALNVNGMRLLAEQRRRSIERDVLDAAEHIGAQLVVLGAGQKGLIEGVLLGSIAEGVLRDAECDVLVIPERLVAA